MSDPRSLAPDEPEFEGFGLSGEHTIYEVAAFWTGRDPYPSELGFYAKEHTVDYGHMEKWVNSCSERTDFRDRTPTLRDFMNDLIRAVEDQRIFGNVVDWNGVLNPYASTVNATAANAILARRGNPLPEPIEATTTLSGSARVSSVTLDALPVLAEGSSSQADDAAFGARQRDASRSGGLARRKRPDAARFADFLDVKSRKPGLPNMQAYRLVAKANNESWQTIQTAVLKEKRRLEAV